jgi:hypothetical protein
MTSIASDNKMIVPETIILMTSIPLCIKIQQYKWRKENNSKYDLLCLIPDLTADQFYSRSSVAPSEKMCHRHRSGCHS